MKKKIIKMILFLAIVIGVFLVYDFWKKSDSYIVTCDEFVMDNGKIKETRQSKDSIFCSKNSDCSTENMNNYCRPGSPSILKCINVKYYCGSDGKCRSYECL